MSNFISKMKFRSLTALFALISISYTACAQTSASTSTSSDEQIIRKEVTRIDKEGKMNFTDNRIFVSGAYPQPKIGKEANPENQAAQEKVNKRVNSKTSSHIQRLEIAQSGDIAYEFGLADLSFDTPDNNHRAFQTSYLRIWRKVDGQWKVDVFFARPNGEQHDHPAGS